jgi:hypothetical protein
MRHLLVLVVAGILASPSIVEAQLPFNHLADKNPYRSLFGERDERAGTTSVPLLASPTLGEPNPSA